MNETHQRHGKWHEVILHPHNGETFAHTMSYNIRGLEPACMFEAIAQAKNRYGWNEVSDLYQFYTRGPGEDLYGIENEPFFFFILRYKLIYRLVVNPVEKPTRCWY